MIARLPYDRRRCLSAGRGLSALVEASRSPFYAPFVAQPTSTAVGWLPVACVREIHWARISVNTSLRSRPRVRETVPCDVSMLPCPGQVTHQYERCLAPPPGTLGFSARSRRPGRGRLSGRTALRARRDGRSIRISWSLSTERSAVFTTSDGIHEWLGLAGNGVSGLPVGFKRVGALPTTEIPPR